MVRECRPPAREPGRSWLARRSTMATSTPANANSPASISPVGPPPAITTACSVMATPQPDTSTRTHAYRPPIRYANAMASGAHRRRSPHPDSWSRRTARVRLPRCPSGFAATHWPTHVSADLPRGDVETIPGVDRGDREHERGELRVVVVARGVVPHVVRNGVRAVGETSGRLGERQSGPLGLGEVRDIAPGGDRVDALVGLARMLELAGVNVDADAATVDLARAQLDEIQRRLGDVGLLGRVADPLQSLQGAGNGECRVIDPCCMMVLHGLMVASESLPESAARRRSVPRSAVGRARRRRDG